MDKPERPGGRSVNEGDMVKYDVRVEKRMYATGIVTIDADDSRDAIDVVQTQIDRGELQTTAVDWGDVRYEDLSFETTGDAESAPSDSDFR